MIIASLNSLIFSYVIIELCNFIDFGYSMINVRYIPLERPLQKYSDGKTLEEAQIAFHAQHLGFINCDREQKPYLSDFVAKFASIKKGTQFSFLIFRYSRNFKNQYTTNELLTYVLFNNYKLIFF